MPGVQNHLSVIACGSNREWLVFLQGSLWLGLQGWSVQWGRSEVCPRRTAETPEMDKATAAAKCKALPRGGEVDTGQQVALCFNLHWQYSERRRRICRIATLQGSTVYYQMAIFVAHALAKSACHYSGELTSDRFLSPDTNENSSPFLEILQSDMV